MGDYSVNFAELLSTGLANHKCSNHFSRTGKFNGDQWQQFQPEIQRQDKGEWIDCVSTIQELERRRIAADLHDGLGQVLTMLAIELRGAKATAASCSGFIPALGLALDRACLSARHAIDELHRTVMDLYPSMLDDLGLIASISFILREARVVRPQLHVDADIAASDNEVPFALRIVAFRILQEAVNNVLKHANAHILTVEFSAGKHNLSLIITDDGCGIPQSGMRERGHSSGIIGMIRRVHDSGGTIDITSSAGQGTTISVGWSIAAPC